MSKLPLTNMRILLIDVASVNILDKALSTLATCAGESRGRVCSKHRSEFESQPGEKEEKPYQLEMTFFDEVYMYQFVKL